MILGGLAANSGFAAREIAAFSADQARAWWNALAAYHERVREQSS